MADNPVILITRPEPQASRFADQLRAVLGHSARIVVCPLSKRRTREVEMPSEEFDVVAFTSESAVLSASERWVGPKVRAFAVGDRTAQCARENGWQTDSAAGTAQDLATLIASVPSAKQVLWPRGGGVTSGFVERCEALSLKVVEWHVYDMVPQRQGSDQIIDTSQQVILTVFSTESAKIAKSIFGHLSERLSIVAISAGSAAVFEGFDNVHIATQPNGEQMIAAILSIFPAREP